MSYIGIVFDDLLDKMFQVRGVEKYLLEGFLYLSCDDKTLHTRFDGAKGNGVLKIYKRTVNTSTKTVNDSLVVSLDVIKRDNSYTVSSSGLYYATYQGGNSYLCKSNVVRVS